MSQFSRYCLYTVLDEDGRSIYGMDRLPADNHGTAQLLLERRHCGAVLRLLIMPGFLTSLMDIFSVLLRRSIPTPVLAEFLHSLGLMLSSGLPVDVALSELREDSSNAGLKKLGSELLASVRSGNSLSAGIELHAHRVPVTVRHLIAIGESSGNLDRMLLDAAAHLNRMHDMKESVYKAMIYPTFVVLTVIGAGLFWVYYVFPDLTSMFSQMGVELPALSMAVIDFVHNTRAFLGQYGYVLIMGVLVFFLLFARSERVRSPFYWLAFRLPVTRVLIRTSSVAYISEYLALLFSAGINLMDCLQILEATTKNDAYRKSIRQARAGVAQGNSLSSELGRSGIFPPMMLRLISVGEQTGTLDRQLLTLATEYRRRLNHMIGTLAEVIKPAVLLLAGSLFLFVIVVFLLPVYDLVAQSTQPR